MQQVYIRDKFINKDDQIREQINLQQKYIDRNIAELRNNKNDMNNNKVINVALPTGPTDAATKQYVDSSQNNMGGQKIINVAPPTLATDAANKQYVDNLSNDMGGKSIRNIGDPILKSDAVNRKYVDAAVGRINHTKNNMDNKTIINVADPVMLTDAANKQYVDARSNDMGENVVTRVAEPILSTDGANKAYVDSVHMGILDEVAANKNNMEGQKIINVGFPSDNNDATNKLYVDTVHLTVLDEVSDSKNNMESRKIISVGDPTNDTDGVNKRYVDNKIDSTRKFRDLNGRTIMGVGDPVNDRDVVNKRTLVTKIGEVYDSSEKRVYIANENQKNKNEDLNSSIRVCQDLIFNKNNVKKMTLDSSFKIIPDDGTFKVVGFEVDKPGTFVLNILRLGKPSKITLQTRKDEGEYIDVSQYDIYLMGQQSPSPIGINTTESTAIDEITMYYTRLVNSYDVKPFVDFNYSSAPELNIILIEIEKPTIFKDHKDLLRAIDFDAIYRDTTDVNLHDLSSFGLIEKSYFINEPYEHGLAYMLMAKMKKSDAVPNDNPHVFVNKLMKDFYLAKVESD